jgi:hypothetical protein
MGKTGRIAALYLPLHGEISIKGAMSSGHTLTLGNIANTVVVAKE